MFSRLDVTLLNIGIGNGGGAVGVIDGGGGDGGIDSGDGVGDDNERDGHDSDDLDASNEEKDNHNNTNCEVFQRKQGRTSGCAPSYDNCCVSCVRCVGCPELLG